MVNWTGSAIRWVVGVVVLGYAAHSFVNHQDSLGAWLGLAVGTTSSSEASSADSH